MNNILNSIKLDYYIMKSSDFKRIAIIAVIALFVGVVTKNPPIMLGIIMMISAFLMGTIFAVVEKNNLNKLYGILPVKKQETVIGRYFFALLAGVIIAVIATILTFVVSYILNVGFGGFTLAVWVCGSFLFFCLLISTQFPLYFKYDFSKLAAFANSPYIVLIIGGEFLIGKEPQLFGQAIKFFVQNQYMIWVVGIIGSLVLLSISTFISIALYKNREL